MAVTIKYGSSTLATVDGGQTATINCEGQKMEGNVVVEVPETPSTELTKGSISVVNGRDGGSIIPFGFVLGMNWQLFIETVGDAAGIFSTNDNAVFAYGYPLYQSPLGVAVLLTDEVIDGATYTT